MRELLAQSGSLFDRGRVLVEVKRDADGTLFSRPMQVSHVIVLAHEFCQLALEFLGRRWAVKMCFSHN